MLVAASLVLPVIAVAQSLPAAIVVEAPAVAARFPAPEVRYGTPGLRAGRSDFASHAEALAFLDGIAAGSPRVRVESIGWSQQGRSIPLVILTGDGAAPAASRPTVLVIGQQHGNEPAGGEAALALVERLAGPRSALLERVNVAVIPRGNPDGADRFERTTASGIDVNRDHLLLATPEGRAIAAAIDRLRPQVVLDLHEFTVAGRWVSKFDAVMKYDALVQPATVGNLEPALAAAAQHGYVDRLHAAWTAAGMTAFAYHTIAADDPTDKVVSMGGVQPDTGRNVAGLRPAISLLIEGRGVGLGRAHYLRRVHVLALAALTVVEAAAEQGPGLVKLVDEARAATVARRCRGEIIIDATHSPARQRLEFLDPRSGADKPIEVDWRAAEPLTILRSRGRPCGYLIAPEQGEALARLRLLGVLLRPVVQAARWDVETYRLTGESAGQRQDARGAIRDGQPIRQLKVDLERGREAVTPGTVYVPLDQPLAGLIIAALEPDSQSSYAANHLLEITGGGLRRVVERPDDSVFALWRWPARAEAGLPSR